MTPSSILRQFLSRTTSHGKRRERHGSRRRLSLERLESKQLLAVSVPEIIIPDDATALRASGFRALSGEEAATYQIHNDMLLLQKYEMPAYELTYERYQQTFGNADVLGGQLTVYRDSTGTPTTVIGSFFEGIVPTNKVGLAAGNAHRIVDRTIPAPQLRKTDLFIDPISGRYFFQVESQDADSRWYHWVDAENGGVLNQFDALAHNDAIGVKGDVKSLAGHTTLHSKGPRSTRGYWLQSPGDRQLTYGGQHNVDFYAGAEIMIDADDHWTSPAQAIGVDAHYYANVVDNYLQDIHGRDSYDNAGAAMRSVVNTVRMDAFWNGSNVGYWNGVDNGVDKFLPTSGALDVVGHEWTHALTDYTSDLIYQDESGALNEAFSDIMGTLIEFYADDQNLDPSATPDFLVAEDVDVLRSDTVPGIRNLADPEEDGDPDHYSEYLTTSDDNGGVHTNSGIPNHAFYLLVNGGLNASCASPLDHFDDHCTGNETPVTAIALSDAEDIFYLAFTGLSSNATMTDARAATEAIAAEIFGDSSQQAQSTRDAWVAVGVGPIAVGNPPTADAGGPYSGTEDIAVTFDGSGSSDPDGDILTYIWDFGDGNTVTTSSPTAQHSYEYGGSFTVTLTVDDGHGGFHTDMTAATVGEVNDVPVADPGLPYAGEAGTAVTFDASQSSDFDLQDGTTANDSQVLTFHWDFGDGNSATTTNSNVDHTYSVDGTYVVTLTVDDGLATSPAVQTTANIAAAPATVRVVDEALIDGTLAGSYLDTYASDDIYEQIMEERYGGNKRSRMEHRWEFHASAGTTYTLTVEAHHDSAAEDFLFEYSTDGGATWISLFTVTSSTDAIYSADLTVGLDGTVLVRTVDTNRSRGENSKDTLFVDELILVAN